MTGERTTHEVTRAYWLPAVENKSAPTLNEIEAGTDLTPQLPIDGIASSNTQNNASQAMMGSAFVPEEPGTWGRAITLTLTRQDGDDPAFTLFRYRTAGYLVVSRFGAVEEGSVVEVYPARAHEAAPLATAENEMQKFEVALAVTDVPDLRATIDGSS